MNTSDVFRNGIGRYAFAVASVVLATWMRFLLTPWVGDRIPFSTYMLAVLWTAWLAGPGPATAALLLGIVAAIRYFITPETSLIVSDPSDLIALLTYAIVSAVSISLFTAQSRQHATTASQLSQIESLSSELRSAAIRKDEFLALLAHELRNPLAPIRNAVQVLQQDSAVQSGTGEKHVRIIRRQLDLLITIVNDLLDVSRFVHRRIALEMTEVDFRSIIDAAAEQVRPAAELQQHDLQVLVPDRPVLVRADRIRLIQTVANLLNNAVKYTPRCGRIDVELFQTDDSAVVVVSDNGIGIAPDTTEQIFELFTRSDAAGLQDQGGLGLGLPIARRFAEMHQGSLVAASRGIGKGSRFELTIPATLNSAHADRERASDGALASGESAPLTNTDSSPPRPEPETGSQSASATRSARNGHREEPIRVLLIDDNRDGADTLSEILTLDGFVTQTAYRGSQGLRSFRDFRPHVVLLDIGLPDMDGFEVLNRIRTDAAGRATAIIAVTGWGGSEFSERTRQAGFDGHLVKPVNPVDLSRLIQQTCCENQAADCWPSSVSEVSGAA